MDTLPEHLEHFLQTHSPVFSTVLFFRPEYGFDFLLQGLAKLRAKYPDLGCVVMGDGDGAVAARLAVLKEEIGDSVLLLGDVPHERCLALVARSNAFLRCTSADGDAISVREALAAGVPVVATDVGHRPAGTLVFPVGSLSSFVAQVESALQHNAPSEPIFMRVPDAASPPRVLELYQQFLPEEVR
jgi:glycosyltransferase involved in cell wall biosynthesis